MSIDQIIDDLFAETNMKVGGVGIFSSEGKILYQTENWDLTPHVSEILDIIQKNTGSISLFGVKYMIVEHTPERIIGTNVTGKGHVILAPFEKGVLVTYILPEVGPRDVLFHVQNAALKLNKV
ncbi:MAG: hypothetical protein JW776_15185 [Candidatus Lokiarchaeota archaeon]|nr:hypothetical protein [Candidatus Lokiarchaeota archaeon]